MKLVDSNGRFQLIKNGQVIIDNTLPKYQKLGIINKAKNNNESLADYLVPVDSSTAPGETEADKTVREMIQEMTSSTLKAYLMSEDANEFNEKFKPILEAEKTSNSYSVNVTAGRWNNSVSYNELYDNTLPEPYNPKSLKYKIKTFVKNLRSVFKKTNDEVLDKEAALKVIDFFDIIHVEGGKEKDFVEKLNGYFTLIRNAAMMHQDAQLDELCQRVILHIYESVLSVHGYNKYIEFSEIEKMKAVGKRVVDIDYIKNFARVIPDDIVEKKLFCDKLGVFDNYCVMYYDPSGESYAATSAAKRDPILFGLINHSEKLYYIADWVDENCDLTLDKVAELCNVNELD